MPEFWRIALSMITVLVLAGLLAWYLTWRASWAFALTGWLRRSLAALLAFGLLATVLSRTLGAQHEPLAAPLGAFGGTVLLSIVISSLLLLPLELLRGLGALRRRLRKQAPQPERRAFLAQAAAGSAIAFGTGASIYGTVFGRRDYTIDTVPVVLDKLPRQLDGLTIVQLSDIHIGTFIGERELAAALSLVRDAKPDLIVMTGDLLDHDPAYAPQLARFTRSLEGVARHGVHAIPGNHDHYAGVRATLNALREGGAEVLFNRHVRIAPGLILGGVDDVKGPQFGSAGPRADLAFAGTSRDEARMLLSHNPSFFDWAAKFADLTLSGHTHGGQITMFINPAKLALRHGLVRGLYHHGPAQLYVNRGFGTAGPPTRIGSPPEVTRLILTCRA